MSGRRPAGGERNGADLPSLLSGPALDSRHQPPKAKRTSRRSSAAASGSSLAVPGASKTVRRSRSREVLPDPPQQVQEESEPEDEPAPPPAPVEQEAKPSKKHRESAKVTAFLHPCSESDVLYAPNQLLTPVDVSAADPLQHPAFVDVEEKEGFSDYNPFQSGGESPDNKRDREKKIRRKVSRIVSSASVRSGLG
jgi:hypothetical protein